MNSNGSCPSESRLVRSAAKGLFPENIPEELRRRAQWVVHNDKQPYTPGTNRRASSTDSLTWRSFEEALAALEAGRCDGIGFVFSSGDPYVGIDLDKCRDPETGALESWAEKIVRQMNGYAEVSPSGRGVHVIVRGKAPNRRSRLRRLEIYSSERFFTVTGRLL